MLATMIMAFLLLPVTIATYAMMMRMAKKDHPVFVRVAAVARRRR